MQAALGVDLIAVAVLVEILQELLVGRAAVAVEVGVLQVEEHLRDPGVRQ